MSVELRGQCLRCNRSGRWELLSGTAAIIGKQWCDRCLRREAEDKADAQVRAAHKAAHALATRHLEPTRRWTTVVLALAACVAFYEYVLKGAGL